MEQNRQNVPFYTLPNGVTIIVDGSGDADGKGEDNGYSQVAILARFPDGDLIDLCYVDYQNNTGKLSVLAFDGTSEEPAYECDNFRFD